MQCVKLTQQHDLILCVDKCVTSSKDSYTFQPMNTYGILTN